MSASDQNSTDHYMALALAEARRAEGQTTPNPAVGAVIVNQGEIVGTGYHPAAGQPHAEIFALRQAGERARGATLYVTLEPCCHQGRTGPCTEAVIAAGIAQVVAATADPNPRVAGQGFARLRAAGIAVEIGSGATEARRLIAPFAKHVQTRLPFVTLKGALTLDGQLATATGHSQWITGTTARQHAHYLRHCNDAVMVGVGTVLADNPRLTTRLAGGGGKDPVRIVVDSHLRTPADAAVINPDSTAPVLIATTASAPAEAETRLRRAGAEVIRLPARNDRVELAALMQFLGERELQAILLEGGGGLNHAAWQAGIVDRIALFFAPLILGGTGLPLFAGPGPTQLSEGRRISDLRSLRLGDDMLLEGEVMSCSPA